jgi:hypothetical protein
MSGAFPTTKNPTVFNFASNRPNSTTYTLSGKRSVKQFAAQYFSFSVQMPPMQQSDFQAFHAFLVKQKGSFDTFTFQYPLDNLGADKNNASVVVNGVHAIGDSTIAMDGFTAALANNEDIDTNQPSFTVALVQDDLLYATDASGFFSLSFDVREVL